MTQSYRYSGNVYQPAAGTTTFALTSSEGNDIAYLQRAHITVSESTDEGETWTDLARPGAWDFDAEGTSVVLVDGTEEGDWIRIKRDTPYQDRFTTFAESSLLTSSQLNTGEDFSMYVDQELADAISVGDQGALKYRGSIDLTADDAPENPQVGWVYINTGSGDVIQGGDPGWVGIVGDDVSGAEQVVYQADATWTILTTPASQVGVLEVTGTAPITVDNTDEQRPVVEFDDAPADTEQYVRQSTEVDGALSWEQVDIPPGTVIADPLPTDPEPDEGQLGYNSGDNRLYIWVLNDDDVGSWVDASPATDAGVTQITAGDNITIDPADGTGNVTINAADSMPTGGGDDEIFYENGQEVTEDYTLTAGTNAGSFGTVTINDDVTVTVPDDSTWVIVGSNDGTDPAGFWERDGTTLSPANDGDGISCGPITSTGRSTLADGNVIIAADGGVNVRNISQEPEGNWSLTTEGNITAVGSVSIGGTDADHTINEYEFGTFTPNFQSGSEGDYANDEGMYVKVGHLVNFTVNLRARGAATGDALIIGNLPFASVSNGWNGAYVVFNQDIWGDNPPPTMTIPGESRQVDLFTQSGNPWQGTTGNDIQNRLLRVAGFYWTND